MITIKTKDSFRVKTWKIHDTALSKEEIKMVELVKIESSELQ